MNKTILCYGDSNTYGFNPEDASRYPKNVRWTGILQQLLGDDFEVIEEGCNGRTAAFRNPNEPWTWGMDFLTTAIYTHHPVDLLVIMLGTNDLKIEFGASAEEIAEGVGKLVDLTRNFCAKKSCPAPEILLVAPPKVSPDICNSVFCDAFDASAAARSAQFAEEYRRVAEARGCLFADAAKVAEPSKTDSLHLMPEAHAALAQLIYQTITE